MMRRRKSTVTTLCILVFALLAILPGSAQAGLEKLFDFSASVESLAGAAESGAALPEGRFVILTGTLRSIEAGEAEPLVIRLELAAGQWIGTSRVVLKTVLISFSGESYRIFLDRESPFFLRPGSTVLAIARVAGVRTGADGSRTIVLEGEHLRRLDG